MTDSLLHTIRIAIYDAQANADATDDGAHIEAAYEACEHIEGRVDEWEKANFIPAEDLRNLLDGDGSAADKVEALHELIPTDNVERELAGVKNMNRELVDRVRELSAQVQRQAETIADLKYQLKVEEAWQCISDMAQDLNATRKAEETKQKRLLPEGLELMHHKDFGTVMTVKGAHRSPEGWVRIHRVRNYERSGPRLTRMSAYPEDLTPITEEAEQ